MHFLTRLIRADQLKEVLLLVSMGKQIRFPVYDCDEDGNVFKWILQASEDFRKIRQRKRDVELEKAAEKSESLDKARMGN